MANLMTLVVRILDHQLDSFGGTAEYGANIVCVSGLRYIESSIKPFDGRLTGPCN